MLPWSPLAGGFLTGKYQRGAAALADSRAGSEKPLYQWISEEYAESERNWDTIDAVVRIAGEIGATPAQVALSWIADRPGVIAPIVGARTVEHLRSDLGAAELTLNDETTLLKRSVRRNPGVIRTEPLAQVNGRVHCKMGRPLSRSFGKMVPKIRPDAPESTYQEFGQTWPRSSIIVQRRG